MFDKKLIPQPNPQKNQHLLNVFNQVGISSQQKSAIEKKIEKVENNLKGKITQTVTISRYFDSLWNHPDLKEKDKEWTIKKLEAKQQMKIREIKQGEQVVAKKSADLDILNEKFKMSPFEEFNHQEKLKHIKKKNKLDIESDLFTNHPRDLEMLHALNRPHKLDTEAKNSDFLHYAAGLYGVVVTDHTKSLKALELVKKLQDEKKVFYQKKKQMEKSMEARELEELERYKKKEQEEEEQRLTQKKKRLEIHIRELKAKSEARIKDNTRWEEEYKAHLTKRPLFKEIETKYLKNHIMPELEQRKQKLQEIRAFHKPIERQEILEHDQKVMKIIGERQQEKKEQLDNSSWSYKKPDYESKYHKIYADELVKARSQKEENHMQAAKKKEKVMGLLHEIKENHLPRVDSQKEMELMGLIEKLKKRRDGRSRTADDDIREPTADPKKLGAEYLKSVKALVQNIRRDNPNISKSRDVDYSTAGRKSESYISTDKKYVIQSTKSEANLRKPNYLTQLRKENKIHSSSSQVDLIIKNKKLDQKERKELLHNEVQKLEEKARRKEMVKKYQVKRNAEYGDEDDEVDTIYINAIKAKLQMLGD